jgi:hypothetical protein
MPSSPVKIALFIDGANLYATTKTLGFEIDYKFGTSVPPPGTDILVTGSFAPTAATQQLIGFRYFLMARTKRLDLSVAELTQPRRRWFLRNPRQMAN